MGVIGYALILALWIWKQGRNDWLAQRASLAIFGMAVSGTIFSLYLTYLEPFVIKAVCAWCLSSAVMITLIMLVNIKPAQDSLAGQSADLTNDLNSKIYLSSGWRKSCLFWAAYCLILLSIVLGACAIPAARIPEIGEMTIAICGG